MEKDKIKYYEMPDGSCVPSKTPHAGWVRCYVRETSSNPYASRNSYIWTVTAKATGICSGVNEADLPKAVAMVQFLLGD